METQTASELGLCLSLWQVRARTSCRAWLRPSKAASKLLEAFTPAFLKVIVPSWRIKARLVKAHPRAGTDRRECHRHERSQNSPAPFNLSERQDQSLWCINRAEFTELDVFDSAGRAVCDLPFTAGTRLDAARSDFKSVRREPGSNLVRISPVAEDLFTRRVEQHLNLKVVLFSHENRSPSSLGLLLMQAFAQSLKSARP